jgi:hypothetical protein
MKFLSNILIVLLLVSCGTRKTQVLKEDIKIEQTTKVTEEFSQVSIKNETLIDTTSITEYFFEPIDSTQPMIIDKKNGVFKNTRFKTTKTKKGISISKKEDSSLETKKSTLDEVSIDIESKDKGTIRESEFPWWTFILAVVLIILGYTKYKRLW